MSEQEKNTEQGVHKRRTRYKGKYPRKFEEKYNCVISDHFDMLCGTSTGGLIALALSLKIPAKTISSLNHN